MLHFGAQLSSAEPQASSASRSDALRRLRETRVRSQGLFLQGALPGREDSFV
jgi:hypothetical protein